MFIIFKKGVITLEEKKRLVRRSADERIAELDKKIAYHQRSIENLEKRKRAIVNGAKRPDYKDILTEMAESGLSPDEMRAALQQITAKPSRSSKK